MGLFSKLKKEPIKPEILAPMTGEAIAVSDVPDEVFAQKVLGDGVAVIPTDGAVYSPVTGVLAEVFDTLHAYAITSDDGLDILVHIGINTVELNGEGFKAFVKTGDKVKAGDKICEVDLELLKNKGYKLHTPVLITNIDDVTNFTAISGNVTGGETVIVKYEK